MALLVNTGSRQGEEAFERARDELMRESGALVCAEASGDAKRLRRLAKAAVDAGARRVVVGAGDGTLSCVAQALVGTDAALGVLPLGTGNDFARSLKIPLDVAEACRVALAGRVREVDVGTAGGRVFLNAASVGLSSAITRRLSSELKRRLGRAAFAVAAAGEAWGHAPFRIALEVDGAVRELDAHQVVVGNGRYHGGGQVVSPHASLEDHRLHAYVIASAAEEGASDPRARLQDLWNLLRVATLLRRGRHVEHPAVVHLSGTRVALSAEPVQEVDVDGELLGHTPVVFGIRPRALKVLVPSER